MRLHRNITNLLLIKRMRQIARRTLLDGIAKHGEENCLIGDNINWAFLWSQYEPRARAYVRIVRMINTRFNTEPPRLALFIGGKII